MHILLNCLIPCLVVTSLPFRSRDSASVAVVLRGLVCKGPKAGCKGLVQ